MDKIEIKNLDLFYGKFQALIKVNMGLKPNQITSIIGPSGCGKSTLLRCINRMNDLIEDVKITGNILIDKEDIYAKNADLVKFRKKIGMVFQRPNPFPLSIYENIAFGPKIHKLAKGSKLQGIVEESLKDVLLWDEVKDKLKHNALNLSLEQKQRLCIARLIAVQSEILLMDEPCSALDPIATLKVEELMAELKERFTIVIVTHNMQQAARISQETGFMLLGKLIEFNKTHDIFTNPKNERTEEYITGRYG